MLSWNDDEHVFTKRSLLTECGSLTRPGNSFEAQRTGSSRRSVDVPAAPGSRKSGEAILSPISTLTTSTSLLRGPANAPKGAIGSEGWWHHMDNSQMNEAPTFGVKTEVKTKTAASVSLDIITNKKQLLWPDEVPVAAASPPPTTSFRPPEPSPKAQETSAPLPPAASGAAMAPSAPAAAPHQGGGTTIQNAGTTGWWAHMDNSILNQPVEKEAGAVHKGERVMGGGFVPQFNVAGGNRYASIFADESVQQQQQQPADKTGVTNALEHQVAGWGPFCSQQGAPAAGSGVAEDDWTSFASAPKD